MRARVGLQGRGHKRLGGRRPAGAAVRPLDRGAPRRLECHHRRQLVLRPARARRAHPRGQRLHRDHHHRGRAAEPRARRARQAHQEGGHAHRVGRRPQSERGGARAAAAADVRQPRPQEALALLDVWRRRRLEGGRGAQPARRGRQERTWRGGEAGVARSEEARRDAAQAGHAPPCLHGLVGAHGRGGGRAARGHAPRARLRVRRGQGCPVGRAAAPRRTRAAAGGAAGGGAEAVAGV
mmetsp:Transcript_1529/g.3945  ORF Transcript_1529/g.3945 Transcript_1529/m.3945 type:complete len:238 (-) Transcript_1529:251-964(-)